MPLTLYYNPLSQPSRTLLAFLHLNDVKYESKVIDILKGEQKSEEFTKVNPMQMIPAISEGNFNLGETEAIIKYLMNTRKVGSMFYPSNAKDRALIDKYLPYHHSTFRPKLCKFFYAYYAFLLPNVTYKVEEVKPEVEAVLKTFEEAFLNGKEYIAGDVLTIADIFAVNELTQIYYTTDFDFSKTPVIKAYIERCLGNPVLLATNDSVKQFGEMMKQKQIQ